MIKNKHSNIQTINIINQMVMKTKIKQLLNNLNYILSDSHKIISKYNFFLIVPM